MSDPRPVVVFDLDGTLTLYDTSLPFLQAVAGRGRARLGVASAWLWALPDYGVAAVREARGGDGALGGVRGRWEGMAHQRVATWTLQGRGRAALEEAGVAFARTVVSGGLRPDALGRIQGHLNAGHRLVLASASLDLYVEPVAALLGFHASVSTRVAFRGGVATGRFGSPVCWGEEKLRRVRAALAPGEEILHAYGDSPGDRPLLEAARHATWVR